MTTWLTPMTTPFAAWFGVGILAAIVHASALWRGTHAARGQIVWLGVRFATVFVVLIGGALAGHILPTATGWATGFAALSTLLLLGSPR